MWAVLLCLALPVAPGLADDAGTLDQALEGFDQPAVAAPPATRPAQKKTTAPRKEPAWRLGGSLESMAVWSYRSHRPPSADLDYQGLTSLKGLARLAVDGRLSAGWRARISGHAWYDLAYRIRGRGEFTSQMLGDMEEELELDQAYVLGALAPGLDLKLGRQVVVWGRSDLFGGLSVFNAKDQREPGLYGVRDTLLPAAMALLEWAPRPWNLALVFQPEYRSDRIPPFGSDFYPFDFAPPPSEEPDWSLREAGWGLRLERDFSGCSLALIGARYSRERELVGLSPEVIQRPVDRLWLAGLSGDLAYGNFVFKMDAAVVDGLTYYQLPGEEKTRLDMVTGVDYSGFLNTYLSLEVAYRHLFDLADEFDGRLDMPRRDTLALGFRASRSFLRERLSAAFTGYIIGLDNSNGGAQRLSLTYKPADGLALSMGILFFQEGDNYLFQHLEDNDRVFLKVAYSF